MISRSLNIVGAVSLTIMATSVASGSSYEKECALHYLEYKEELDKALVGETNHKEVDQITQEIAIRHYGSNFQDWKIQEDKSAYDSIKKKIETQKKLQEYRKRNPTSRGNKSNRPKLALELKKKVVSVDNEEKKSEILDEVNNRTINEQLSTEDVQYNTTSRGGSEENKGKLKNEISLAISINKLPNQSGLKEETNQKDKIETLHQEVEVEKTTFDNSVQTTQEGATIKLHVENVQGASNIKAAINDEKGLHEKENETNNKVVLKEANDNSPNTNMRSRTWNKITNFFKRTWGYIKSLFKF